MMKRLLLLMLAIVALVACDDLVPKPSNPNKNKMVFEGKDYPLVYGAMSYMGPKYPGNVEQNTSTIDIVLSSEIDGYGVAFRINVPDPETKPINGDYYLSNSCREYTFSKGQFIKNNGQYLADYKDITYGALQIVVDGGTYIMNFECMIGDDEFPGTYTGGLVWSDKS